MNRFRSWLISVLLVAVGLPATATSVTVTTVVGWQGMVVAGRPEGAQARVATLQAGANAIALNPAGSSNGCADPRRTNAAAGR